MSPFVWPMMGWCMWWSMVLPRPQRQAEVVDLADWRRSHRRA